ncbi:transmembrane amino acid transporter protein-domain-containing protein [Hygrophoropsis aurantiaca]|uniref:Transmembrane amino acid transporter protein-domain-containing protein n=1 Tax=Hygrophoropsis aurantiaca TaxID=72124 RepID=A0ACB8A9M3_9AGAM|nr:transmembrane amino acid transporter protein-domain-containing protein [Hygrophoropsis aurantiaca]
MAYVPPANLEGSFDPRIELSEQEQEDWIAPPIPVLPDGSVPLLETYLYHAEIQRQQEKDDDLHDDKENTGGFLTKFFKSGSRGVPTKEVAGARRDSLSSSASEKKQMQGVAPIAPGEYRTASGALRTATWGSVFYLITTDILGPYSTPYAFNAVGYGPGVACFFVFGVMAAYGGLLLWWMFLKLDSSRYPVRTFGDLGYRIYGHWFRHVVNILQTIQLIFNVAIIILGNGQGLSQMAKFRLCFSVCNVVWTLGGMILGQIRTLRKFGSVANLAIWMNVLVLIMTMGCVAHMVPNYIAVTPAVTQPYAPVQTVALNAQPFETQLTGIMQIVYSYGGAMLFTEFMAEMRRPYDFWKAMAYAQAFIFVVYMFFGLFVYSYQGQYVVNPANQGISSYGLQTATNAISLTAGLIAAALYGNIGIKVIYNYIFTELFNAPPLTSPRGKWLFGGTVIVYWSLAFVIGSAIPQFSNITALVGAACIFQFSYTFPPFMMLGYCMQVDAIEGDSKYDDNNPRGARTDTWKTWARWKRALIKRPLFNLWNFLLTLACLSAAILSAYSAIKAIITGFQGTAAATSFGCHSPVDNS